MVPMCTLITFWAWRLYHCCHILPKCQKT